MNENKILISIKEACAVSGKSQITIKRLTGKKIIHSEKVRGKNGMELRVDKNEVLKYFDLYQPISTYITDPYQPISSKSESLPSNGFDPYQPISRPISSEVKVDEKVPKTNSDLYQPISTYITDPYQPISSKSESLPQDGFDPYQPISRPISSEVKVDEKTKNQKDVENPYFKLILDQLDKRAVENEKLHEEINYLHNLLENQQKLTLQLQTQITTLNENQQLLLEKTMKQDIEPKNIVISKKPFWKFW